MKREAPNILVILGLFVVPLSCCTPVRHHKAPSVEFLNSPGAASLPFSEAVRVGNMLYLSGQVGVLPGTTKLVPGGIKPEARQALENMKAILERNGSSLDRVVKCSVFLADIAEWPLLNEVYRTYFPDDPPARSALAASGLAFNARVEIECIAVVGAGHAEHHD